LIVAGNESGGFTFSSYRIDHASQTLSSSGTQFWTLCGDHADVGTDTNGSTYLAVFNCWDEPAIYRVDVTTPQTAGDVGKQRSDNVRLVGTDWQDAGHFSCVSKGPNRDWCYASIESGDDQFGDQGGWRPYKQEIVAMQMVPPFAVRRLAHHRSRSPFSNYTRSPRVNVSWDGSKVAFSSDYGYDGGGVGYSDIYFVDMR
jgi:hypothetical protein